MLLPDISGPGECGVRIAGPSVDVMLLVNKNHEMTLLAGRPDWAFHGEAVKFTLQIDTAPAISLDGSAVANLLVFNPGGQLSDQLKKASALTWNLPWGKFHAEVTGLGKAFDALKLCESPKP